MSYPSRRSHVRIRVAAVSVCLLAAGAAHAEHPACTTHLKVDLPDACEDIAVIHDLEGAGNFREIVLGTDGKPRLKQGVLFRSGALHELTEADVRKLEDRQIRTIVDLRSPTEIEDDPDKAISTVENREYYAIGPGRSNSALPIEPETAARLGPMFRAGQFEEIDEILTSANVDTAKTRRDRYRSFALEFNDEFGGLLRLLADEENLPLVFHCQGGKDRAGFGSAVILLSLGFSREDAIRDYLATNLYYYDRLEKALSVSPESLRPFLGAHREQIVAALDAIEKEYGSFDDYRRSALGVSDEDMLAIRANLLAEE